MSRHLREEEFIPYLDGRLSEAERARLDEHLAACADCRVHLDELRAVQGVLGEWKAVQPSSGFDAILRARLAEETPRPEPWYAVRPAYAAALGVAVAAAVGIVLWQPAPPEVAPPPVAQTQPPVVTQPPTIETPSLPNGGSDELAVLDNPTLLENYELLEEFDVLFEPTAQEEEEKL